MKWTNVVIILGVLALIGFLGNGVISCTRDMKASSTAGVEKSPTTYYMEEEGYIKFGKNGAEEDFVVRWLDRGAMPSSYYVIDNSWHPYPLIIPLCEQNIERYGLPLDYILEQIAEMYKYK